MMPLAEQTLANYLTDRVKQVVRHEVMDKSKSQGKPFSRTYASGAGYFDSMEIPKLPRKTPNPPSHPKSPLFREFSPPAGGKVKS